MDHKGNLVKQDQLENPVKWGHKGKWDQLGHKGKRVVREIEAMWDQRAIKE